MINKENLLSEKAGMSYVQIAILIIASFAFSYLIYSYSNPNSGVSAEETDSTVSGVNADGTVNVCCEKTTDGKSCEYVSADKCAPGSQTFLTPCDQISQGVCAKGCCFSEKIGSCNPQSSSAKCTDLNGTFNDKDPMCGAAQCRVGCCSLGNGEVHLTTERNCQFLGNSQNPVVPTEWNPEITSELKCQYLTQKDKEGACVFNSGSDKTCVFETLDSCISRTQNETNFDVRGKFCSDPDLNTTCRAHDHKGCIDGKDDVYWFDSCGNHEEAADDCDLFKGTYCGKVSGEYVCKDVDCVIDGKKRMNGESWCEYDNVIGKGKDPAGSRHVRHVCYMGTERIQPCDDYRNQICVESTSSTTEGKQFSQAACRVNNWRRCLELNSKKNVDEMKEKCQKNPDCWLKNVDMSGSFNFWVCLPSYPPGFNLDDSDANNEQMYSQGDSICSIATQRCTETWICGIFGCICVDNCDCHTAKFTTEMNDFCIALGDCGAYINYIGTYTDGGYGVKSTGGGPPRVNMQGLTSRAGEKPAKPGDMEFFETLNMDNLKDLDAYKEYLDSTGGNSSENRTAFQKEIERVSGAMGSPLLLYMVGHDTVNGSLDEQQLNGISPSPVNSVGFFNGYSSVRSAISAQIVTKDIKAGGFEMIAALIAGLIAYIIFQSIMIAFMAALLAYLFALAWIMYVYIDFTCGMWERPSGGADCNKCNTLDVPCTEYRCQSLGETCKFVNKGTNNELCLTIPPNTSLPEISPLYSVIEKGYKYTNVNEKGFEITTEDGGCLDAFTSINMGIAVSPFAKCRFGVDPKQKWEELPEKFGIKGESILPAHQMTLFYPSPEAVKNSFAGQTICNQSGKPVACNLTDEQLKELTKVDIYVKCKTADGKQNPEPYNIKTCVNPGPDLTAPVVRLITPGSGSYVKYDQGSQEITAYVNEPSDCRWSSTPDTPWDQMENQLDCKTNIIDYTYFGLPCKGVFNVTNNDTTFYIKCQDLSENRNNMTQDYVYEIKKSESPLNITDFRPLNKEEMIVGEDPVLVTLKVQTAGGAEDGESTCNFTDSRRDYIRDFFPEKDSDVHEYNLNLPRGEWNITYACSDVAGNFASNSTLFKILIDDIGPRIVRVFNDGGLKVMTDELSRCRMSPNKNFIFENATEMDSDYKLEHFGPWSQRIYYVQCRDQYGNPGSKMTVSPYEDFSY